jgi:hypothetical protein
MSEIFTRQKHHTDLKSSGWLRLDPGESKNGEGRNFPFTVGLREIIAVDEGYKMVFLIAQRAKEEFQRG